MRGIQCKRCFFFTPEWCPKKRDSLDPDLIRDCQYFRIKTNADRIRAMTDEELANMWFSYVDCGECPMHRECNMLPQDCLRLALEWLKQEAAE